MARKSSIENDRKCRALVKKYQKARAELKAVALDKNATAEDRFNAQLKLAKLPRNSSAVRPRNRCEMTGRARGFYRKFKISRIMLRELASSGQLPGVIKSSW